MFTLLLLSLSAPAWSASEEQAAVDAIQKHYESVHTFKATFEQRAFVKVMNRVEVTRGKVQIKKPGKMKWVYNAPDPQILISNQKNLWLYVPEDGQVIKMPVENVYSSNTPALFLAGRGKLTDSFNVAQVIPDENEITVVFVPKEEDSNLSRLTLRADKKNYQITGASVYDKLGNKTDIRFRDILVNEEIAENIFDFKVPEGVEVQDFTSTP
ncbi:membrane protein [Candidatus Nitromaritima sp. SCGC AAA799-C22]|nr:membrane protein [Candidatus Nitromaritima sp. SCGC AAA799-C22]